LQGGAGGGGGLEDRVPVGVDRGAAADQPGGGVPDDVDVGVLAGGDDPAGQLVAVLGEVGVHRGDAQVEAGQEVVVPVDAARRVDVQLGAVQQHHVGVAALQGGDLLALGEHLLVGHPLHEKVRRVVGDGVVVVPQSGRGGDHVLQRGDA